MTFQDAQTQFSNIVGSITPATSSDQLLQKQRNLQALLVGLPNTPEFDPIAEAIADFSPRLAGQLTQEVVKDLQSRDNTLEEASGLLTQAANNANADARTLTFEEPKLVLSALVSSVAKLHEISDAAKAGNLVDAASKADALVLLLQQVQQTIKAV
jgi:hypothetical protein